MNAPETTPQGGGSTVSRKEFLGLAMMGAIGAARPRLTRGPLILMMGGGGGGAWRNPYITDGLIGMWDGEWNAGGGVHDDSPPTVANIVSQNGSLDFNAGVSFASKSFKCAYDITTTSNVGIMSSSSEFGEYLFDLDNATWEFCLSDARDRYTYVWNSFLCKIGTGVNANGNSVNLYDTRGYVQYGMFAANSGFVNVGACTLSYVLDNTKTVKSKLYTNASLYKEQNNARQSDPSMLQLGVLDELYCVRVYNRMLTASEVAANYAVDKARFGLT